MLEVGPDIQQGNGSDNHFLSKACVIKCEIAFPGLGFRKELKGPCAEYDLDSSKWIISFFRFHH